MTGRSVSPIRPGDVGNLNDEIPLPQQGSQGLVVFLIVAKPRQDHDAAVLLSFYREGSSASPSSKRTLLPQSQSNLLAMVLYQQRRHAFNATFALALHVIGQNAPKRVANKLKSD